MDKTYLQAIVGMCDRFLAELPECRVLERLGFESQRKEAVEQLAAGEAIAVALFGWLDHEPPSVDTL